MNTRIPLFLLMGAIASAPALSADRAVIAASSAGDAQVQAAALLRAEVSSRASVQPIAAVENRSTRSGHLSAQAQAADLLTGHLTDHSLVVSGEDTGPRSHSPESTLVRSHGVSDDAQRQAQRILRANSPNSETVVRVASH